MELWTAEIFDYSFETPMLIGVYDTEEKAWDAVNIVLAQHKKRNPDVSDERFTIFVGPVQLNGFCPGVMDFLGTEIMEDWH